MTEEKNNTGKNVTAEILFYLANAFKAGVEGGFLAREHATAIFKSTLRAAGYEVPNKKTGEITPEAATK
jgi:hypothetical protein